MLQPRLRPARRVQMAPTRPRLARGHARGTAESLGVASVGAEIGATIFL